MSKSLRLLGLCLLAALSFSCVTTQITTVTNLTASRLPRKANGQYGFSVDFDTRQRTLIKDTLRVSVVVGENTFPMERTPLLTNRWETLVPIPATQDVLTYRYRFEYDYKAIPDIRSTVRDSNVYQLYIQPQ
jgi:hypothetical protein